jgi:hypothetical protein
LYRPTVKLRYEYAPAELVVVLYLRLFAGFCNVRVIPGTAAPVASVIVPEIEPRSAWANKAVEINSREQKRKSFIVVTPSI